MNSTKVNPKQTTAVLAAAAGISSVLTGAVANAAAGHHAQGSSSKRTPGSFTPPMRNVDEIHTYLNNHPSTLHAYARHFQVSPEAFMAYVKTDLVLKPLSKNLDKASFFYIDSNGAVQSKEKNFKKGEMFFCDRETGRPILKANCGNPYASNLPTHEIVLVPGKPVTVTVPGKDTTTYVPVPTYFPAPAPPAPNSYVFNEGDIYTTQLPSPAQRNNDNSAIFALGGLGLGYLFGQHNGGSQTTVNNNFTCPPPATFTTCPPTGQTPPPPAPAVPEAGTGTAMAAGLLTLAGIAAAGRRKKTTSIEE